MANPCSQESVYSVMKHVQNICSVGANENRKWAILISDGVPYTLASDIQDFVLFCQEWGMEVDRKGISSAEFEEFLITQESLCRSDIPINKRFTSSFMNLLLLPGLDRMELNQSRILLKLLWEPILSHVVSLLGFRTPRAKQVVKEGIDHHRSRQILEVCLEAISKELLTPYARDCMKSNTTPNAESYQIWLSNVKDRTYLFYYHVTFSFLLSFHLLTEAVGKNNADHIMVAQVQFAPLFFSFHHPRYQHFFMRDICQRVQIPGELNHFVSSHEYFSLSGKDNAGQGVDFVHEERNKRIKAILLPLMPTEETWTRICSNLKDLEELCNSIFKISPSQKKFPNLTNEITMIRREVRSSLFVNGLTKVSPITSFGDAEIDPELVIIKYISKENYENYKLQFITSGQYGAKIQNPLIVTAQHGIAHEKIENKIMEALLLKIKDLLLIIPDKEIANGKSKELAKFEKNGKKTPV